MAFVQSNGGTQSGTADLAVAYSSNVAAGNLLVVCTHINSGMTFTSVTDSQGNTYNQIGTELTDAGTATVSRMYYAIAGSSAANTVTMASGGSGFQYMTIHEFSSTTTFDVADRTTGSGTTLTSPSVTAAAPSLVVGFGICSGTGSAGGGWNSRQTTNGNITEDQTAGPGSVTSSATQTPSGAWAMWVAVFNSGVSSYLLPEPPRPARVAPIMLARYHRKLFGWPIKPTLVITSQTFPQALDATVTTTSAFVLQVGKNISATATSTASIVKQVTKALTATVTSTTSLLAQKVILLALTATVTSTATMARQVGKLLSATVTTTASIVKQVNKLLTATVTSTATLSAIKVILKTMQATVTTTSTFTLRTGKQMQSTVTSTASVVKQVGKRVAATVTSTASLLAQKVILKALTATVTATATITRRVGVTAAATVTTAATVTRQIGKTLAATVSSLADIVTELISASAVIITRFFSGPRPGGSTGSSPDSARFSTRPGGSSATTPTEDEFDSPNPGGQS